MTKSVRGSLAALVLVLGTFLGSLPAQAAVGRTAGTFAVSPTGATTYTIPIFAPHGPGGVQPNISLVYNSQSGIGFVGIGWSLAGLSAISRCNHTYAQDGAPAPIALATSDGYCLDGQRLRLTGGTYGGDSSTYQTELANFSLVTAHGAAGNGPAYFTVQGRDGLTYEYGNGGSSQVLAGTTGTASMWMLDKVTDRAGNTMAYTYTTATGAALPATISWTPSSYGSTTYNYIMQFNYGANVSYSSYYGYVAGTPVTDTSLLGSITISYAGATIKNYVLSYQIAPNTGRDELIQVQECADSGATNCVAPTKITYQSGAQGVGGAITLGTASGSQPPPTVLTAYDLNGDGKTDFVYQDSGGSWWVAFGGSSGFGTPVNTGITNSGAIIEDVDGSGTDGFLVPVNGNWSYYKWNGSTFSSVSTGVSVDSTVAGSYALADVNGDGLPDLITTRSDGYLYVRLNTSTSSQVSFSSTATRTTQNGYYAIFNSWNTRRLDFYGSGQQDLIALITMPASGQNAGEYILHFNGTTFTTTYLGNLGVVDVGDFNDDGCTDILTYNAAYLSGCNGAPARTVSIGYTAVIGIDWDGDGRRDVLVQNGSTLGVLKWNGYAFTNLINTSLPSSGQSVVYYLVSNPTGDRLDGLIAEPLSAPYTFRYYLHNGAGQPPDLLASVVDGYGNSASPTYVPFTQSNYSAAFNPTYPDAPTTGYRFATAPLYVANQVTFSDPSNPSTGTYQQSFWYYDAWVNLQGRGFSGFKQFGMHDSRTGLWDTTGYAGAFPASGVFAFDLLSHDQLGNQVIRYSFANDVTTTLDGTTHNQRYFNYYNSTTVQTYEVGGPKDGQLVRTDQTTYVVDNYNNPTTITETITDKDTTSPYYNQSWTTTTTNTTDVDPTHWCLTLFTQTQVAYTSTYDTTPVTRTRSFAPDTVNCRNTQTITEPSSSQYKVTESFGFDSFGNINSDTVTGIGMAARQTTAGWGATGQFPMSVTDATGALTQYNYNFSFGLRSSLTDPNGLMTSWIYDSFGRMSQESRRDGTYTQWTYNDCSVGGSCLIGTHTPIVTFGVHNRDGSVLTDGSTWFDPLERPYLSNKRMLASGAYDRNEQRYDSLGRMVQQAFPCTWSSVATTCPYWTTNHFDALNRITQSQRPISSTNSSTQQTVYQYEGRTTIITDANGHAKTLIGDVNARLRQTQDANGYVVILGYDAAGSKNSTTDSRGNVLFSANYAYGIAPFVTQATDADLGTFTNTYDALGENTARQDPKGQHFSAAYDALSRLTDRYEPDLYTHWTWGTSASAHEIGQLHSLCTGTGSAPTTCASSPGYAESETYDGVGRQSQRAIQIPGDATYTFTWQYNATTGVLDTLTYPVSTNNCQLIVKYGYANGILATLTDVSNVTQCGSTGTTLWTANTVNPRGQVGQETLGNRVVVNHAFDAVTGWVGSITAGVGGGAGLQNNTYLFDYVGNLTQRQDNNLGLTENVYPDALDRIDHTTLTGGTYNGTNLALTYDPTGNILTSQLEGGTASSQNFSTNQPGCTGYSNPQPHALRSSTKGSQVTAFCYDANGNVVKVSISGFPFASATWTSYNQLASLSALGAGSSQFSYDGNHQRYKQIATFPGSVTETTIYVGELLEKVTNPNGTFYRHYVPAGNNVAIYNRWVSGTNAVYYLTTDHLGSTTAITDSSGNVVVKENFATSGARRGDSWTGKPTTAELTSIDGVTHRGFTFQERLDNVNLTDFNGRIYGETGQFFSPDPYISDPTDTQSYNRYSYARNNPLRYTDPSGYVLCFNGGVFNPPYADDLEYTIDWFASGNFNGVETLEAQCQNAAQSEVDITGSRWSWPTPDRTQQPLLLTPGLGAVGTGAGGASQGHNYQTQNLVCNRPLTAREGRDLISRFTVPNVYTQDQPKTSGGTYLVANTSGIPGGWVTTTFAPDGLQGANVTTPFHVFTGTVVRTLVNTSGGAYIQTHGYGGYGSLQMPPVDSGGMFAFFDIGRLLDSINDLTGPAVFNDVDQEAAEYAAMFFPGCGTPSGGDAPALAPLLP